MRLRSPFKLIHRGPHETGWIGWHGGFELFKKEKMTDLSPTAITERQTGRKIALGGVQLAKADVREEVKPVPRSASGIEPIELDTKDA